MKRFSKSVLKIIRKRRKQSRRQLKVALRKMKKTRRKAARVVRRQRAQLIKRQRQLLKQLHKSRRAKTKKSVSKGTKAPAQSKKSRQQPKTPLYPVRLLLPLMIIAGMFGAVCGHLWAQDTGRFSTDAKKTAASNTITVPGPAQSAEAFSTYPTWAQDFTRGEGQPDNRYWNTFLGEPQNDNQEAQHYTANPDNVRIKQGALSLTAIHKQQSSGSQYTSARVDTEGKMSFLYGRMDVTAKLPRGTGTWPAIWLLPTNNKYADLSPTSDRMRHINGGELDIVEAIGSNPNIVYGVVHTRSDLDNPNHLGEFNQVTVPGNDVGYNRYSLLWTPTSVTYEVNDTPFFTYTKQPGADYTTWPFDQPFYLIMNLALGGKWAGQDTANFPGNGIDDAALPASLDIKSVYYYPYIGQ